MKPIEAVIWEAVFRGIVVGIEPEKWGSAVGIRFISGVETVRVIIDRDVLYAGEGAEAVIEALDRLMMHPYRNAIERARRKHEKGKADDSK